MILSAMSEKPSDKAEKPGSPTFWRRLRLPERLRLDRLKRKLSLHGLSDEKLDVAIVWSRRLGLFAAGHAGVWVAMGAAGAVAVGLRALGVCLLPASLGIATLGLGAALALKSVVGNRLCMAIHDKCKAIKQQRAAARAAPAVAAAPAAAAPEKLAGLSRLKGRFNSRSRPQVSRPSPALEAGNPLPFWLMP
jgi:hypothetical protein